jgi:hypothetical protein
MTTLLRVQEVSDLFVDACVRHPTTGELLFLSAYGRDGALLEFFAAFSLPKDKGGLTQFTLLDDDGTPSSVYVNHPKRLAKFTGKLPKGNIFGNLGQAWLYDEDVVKPDRANRTAWGLYTLTEAANDASHNDQSVRDRVWQQLKDLSPVPLADEWQSHTMHLAAEQGFLQWLDVPDNLFPPLGNLLACRIDLGDRFVAEISAAVRSGALQVQAQVPPAKQLESPAPRPSPAVTKTTTNARRAVELGRVVVTRAVDASVPKQFVLDCLMRHRQGDWGCTCAEDSEQNDGALRSGRERLHSVYELVDSTSSGIRDDKLWVITEWDRSVTTVLFPSDY